MRHMKDNIDKTETFELEEDDTLSQIKIHLSKNFFSQIEFTSNKGTKSYGYPHLNTEESQTIDLNASQKIIACYGQFGWVVDALGFIIREEHDE